MKMNASVRLERDMTVKDLEDVLATLPDRANVGTYHYIGDRPGESGYSELRFSWEV